MVNRFSAALLFRLLLAVALVALTAFWLFGARWKIGYDNWFITPNPTAWPALAWLQPIGALAIFGGLAAFSAYDRFRRAKTPQEQRTSTGLSLVALCLLAVTWSWSLMGPTAGGATGASNLITSTWSDVANGYFSAAYEVRDVRAFSREYAARHQEFEVTSQAHVATHPPGAVLFYYGARRIVEASPFLQNTFSALARSLTHEEIATIAFQSRSVVKLATGKTSTLPDSAVAAAMWCAFLISLVLAATVPAVYGMAAAGGGNAAEARGLWAAAFFVLAPTSGLFSFTLDVVIACGTAWTLFFVARYLCSGSLFPLLAAGVTLALTSFVSFGALAVWGIVGLALLLHSRAWFAHRLRRDHHTIHNTTGNPFTSIGTVLAGFVGGWVLLLILFPTNILLVFSQAMEAHRIATFTRSPWMWSLLNLPFFLTFMGWPLVAILTAIRKKPLDLAFIMGCATLATTILLTVSGNVRGEVERLWLFLLPALCALGGSILADGAPARSTLTPEALSTETLSTEAASEDIALTEPPQIPVKSARLPQRIPLHILFAALLLALQALQTLIMAAGLSPLVRL
jgi:hypothetical protein